MVSAVGLMAQDLALAPHDRDSVGDTEIESVRLFKAYVV